MYVYFKNIFICAYLCKDFIVFLLLLTFSTLFFNAWQIFFWGGGCSRKFDVCHLGIYRIFCFVVTFPFLICSLYLLQYMQTAS